MALLRKAHSAEDIGVDACGCAPDRTGRTLSEQEEHAMRKEHLEVTEYDRNAVVRAPGSLGKDTAENVGAAMVSCLDKGDIHLVLDLGDAMYINSDGLRMLQEVQRHAESLEASLALANPNDRVMRTLNMTRMDKQLPIYESVEAALNNNNKQ